MKIRTEETCTKYETWEYEIDIPLPEDFASWNPEDQYGWLGRNCVDAIMISSEHADLGSIDEYEIVG